MTRWLILILTVVLLSSCIGIESEILLRQDGTGVLTLSYQISQFIKNIDAGREEKQLPLPVNEEEFVRTAEGIEGLRLTDIDEREDEENVYIRAELEFDSLDAVNALGRAGEIGISLENQGDINTFRQVIFAGQEGEEITEDSLEMIETFFQGYDLVYSITVPTEVQSHSLGDLSADGRTVTYTITVPEILRVSAPLVMEVVW
jgi:hypothetical protein